MTKRRFESREEWELMYRSGLTQARIADLCSVPQRDINRAIGWAKRWDASLQEGHLANRPPVTQTKAGLTVEWLARRDEFAAFLFREGRTPSRSSTDPAETALGRWLSAQRSASRLGVLLPARRASAGCHGQLA